MPRWRRAIPERILFRGFLIFERSAHPVVSLYLSYPYLRFVIDPIRMKMEPNHPRTWRMSMLPILQRMMIRFRLTALLAAVAVSVFAAMTA